MELIAILNHSQATQQEQVFVSSMGIHSHCTLKKMALLASTHAKNFVIQILALLTPTLLERKLAVHSQKHLMLQEMQLQVQCARSRTSKK